MPVCEIGKTSTNGFHLCPGLVFFDDNFNSFDKFKWRHTLRISSVEDEEFVIYDNKVQNVYVKDKILHIKPVPMSDDEVSNADITIKKCTGYPPDKEECKRISKNHQIVPPVYSAQIKSQVAFKYGKVEIIAKLPVGDWITPQIWLEPKDKKYGHFLNSGKIVIARCNGNSQLLNSGGKDMGVKTMQTGIMMGTNLRNIKFKGNSAFKSTGWHRDFHNFTILWLPDEIKFFVDGVERTYFDGHEKISNIFNFKEKDITEIWNSNNNMAPFDEEFYLTLGVSVGGRQFLDNTTTTDGTPKPWKNGEVKQNLNFWMSRDKWLKTWNNEDTALKVAYVKITTVD